MGWSKFLFGKTCLGCDERLRVGQEGAWCGSCAPAVLSGGRWMTAVWNGDSLPVAAALVYGGPVADAVTRVKKGHLPELTPVLPLMVRLVELVAPRPEPVWLVAVPPHLGRLAERGLHFPDLLTTGVAHRRRDMRVAWALERLDLHDIRREDRSRAPEFRTTRAGRRPKAGRVVLVDDVVTTGQTLATAAAALRAAGWDVAAAICLADARPGMLDRADVC
ncbi:MAG: phosphoribosyltransferase family protein [Myxococcota bacterium]